MKTQLTREELLTLATICTARGYALLEAHPKDQVFVDKAIELFGLGVKCNELATKEHEVKVKRPVLY